MTLNLVYGYRVTTYNDPYVAAVEHATYMATKYVIGAVPVDFLPICTWRCQNAARIRSHNFAVRFLPEWFPGAGFVKHAKETDIVIQGLCDELFDFVKKQKVSEIPFLNENSGIWLIVTCRTPVWQVLLLWHNGMRNLKVQNSWG